MCLGCSTCVRSMTSSCMCMCLLVGNRGFIDSALRLCLPIGTRGRTGPAVIWDVMRFRVAIFSLDMWQYRANGLKYKKMLFFFHSFTHCPRMLWSRSRSWSRVAATRGGWSARRMFYKWVIGWKKLLNDVTNKNSQIYNINKTMFINKPTPGLWRHYFGCVGFVNTIHKFTYTKRF